MHDVAVIGVPDPRRTSGCARSSRSTDGDDPFTFAEMQDFLLEHGIRNQAIPEQLELVDVIPRNASGKITKNVLREKFGGGNGAPG